MPTYLPWALHAAIAMLNRALTAGSRSSKSLAKSSKPESRSKPKVSWVRSLEPIEKPSKYCKKSLAKTALLGISHIMISFKSFSPRLSPLSASNSVTRLAWAKVRTKGTITCTLVKPMSSRTRFKASHSIAKASRKSSLT